MDWNLADAKNRSSEVVNLVLCRKGETEGELLWPFLHVLVSADDAEPEAWAVKDFGTGRQQRSKGVVGVRL